MTPGAERLRKSPLDSIRETGRQFATSNRRRYRSLIIFYCCQLISLKTGLHRGYCKPREPAAANFTFAMPNRVTNMSTKRTATSVALSTVPSPNLTSRSSDIVMDDPCWRFAPAIQTDSIRFISAFSNWAPTVKCTRLNAPFFPSLTAQAQTRLKRTNRIGNSSCQEKDEQFRCGRHRAESFCTRSRGTVKSL